MSVARCRRCGEEMLPWQYSPELGVCTDCYVIDDRGRFADCVREMQSLSDMVQHKVIEIVAAAFAKAGLMDELEKGEDS